MANEINISTSTNKITVSPDSITYVDFLALQKTNDTTVIGLRFDKRNLPTMTAFLDANNHFTGHNTIDSATIGNLVITGGATGDLNGNASSASKLTSGTVGSTSKPVYFSNGVPKVLTNVIDRSLIPSNYIPFNTLTYNLMTNENQTAQDLLPNLPVGCWTFIESDTEFLSTIRNEFAVSSASTDRHYIPLNLSVWVERKSTDQYFIYGWDHQRYRYAWNIWSELSIHRDPIYDTDLIAPYIGAHTTDELSLSFPPRLIVSINRLMAHHYLVYLNMEYLDDYDGWKLYFRKPCGISTQSYWEWSSDWVPIYPSTYVGSGYEEHHFSRGQGTIIPLDYIALMDYSNIQIGSAIIGPDGIGGKLTGNFYDLGGYQFLGRHVSRTPSDLDDWNLNYYKTKITNLSVFTASNYKNYTQTKATVRFYVSAYCKSEHKYISGKPTANINITFTPEVIRRGYTIDHHGLYAYFD